MMITLQRPTIAGSLEIEVRVFPEVGDLCDITRVAEIKRHIRFVTGQADVFPVVYIAPLPAKDKGQRGFKGSG